MQHLLRLPVKTTLQLRTEERGPKKVEGQAVCRGCPSSPNSIMKACILIGVLVMVDFVMGKVPDIRTCHFCLLEDTSLGCISGSEKCTVSSSSPCMVITIYSDLKARFNVRGCGQHNNYRCQEKRNTYFSEYWYKAECCQYDYCNSWSKARLRDPLRSPSKRPLPLPDPQTHRFYRALNLSLPLPGFHAEKELEGLDPLTLPLELGFSIADLRRIYLFLNSSGLLALPRGRP